MKATSLGKKVDDVSEHFTSKTCYRCAGMTDIGKSKVFECSYCGYIQDRDINAAYNILVKNLGSYSPALISMGSKIKYDGSYRFLHAF